MKAEESFVESSSATSFVHCSLVSLFVHISLRRRLFVAGFTSFPINFSKSPSKSQSRCLQLEQEQGKDCLEVDVTFLTTRFDRKNDLRKSGRDSSSVTAKQQLRSSLLFLSRLFFSRSLPSLFFGGRRST